MSSISGVIPNVIGGISQQPPAARLENTAGDLKNAITSVVSGLRKRPPFQYVATLMDKPTSSIAQFPFERPNEPLKFLVLADNTIKVFDETGVEEPVTVTGSAAAYITDGDPQVNLGFHPVADSVFIYNKTKIVGTTTPAETRSDPNDQITMVIEDTAGGAKYVFEVSDGVNTQTGTYTTSTTDPIDVNRIAKNLKADFDANGPLTAQRKGNVLVVTGVSNYDTFTAEPASLTGAYKTTVEKFTDLPLYEVDGRIVEIRAGVEEQTEAYYVQYDKSTRLWTETFGYNEGIALDPATMPHLLKDNGDGTWELAPQVWNERTSGDSEADQLPSFVGFGITSMFHMENRMCILSDENLTTSEVNRYENFFRTTCATLVSSDRLDAAALTTDNRLARLHHAVDFVDSVLLFSDKTQFKLPTDDGLSPDTISLRAETAFNASTQTKPVKLGNNVVFVDDSDNSSWADIREYVVDNVVGTTGSEIITKQVPELIPSGVTELLANSTLNILLALSKGNTNRIYVYSTFYSNGSRIQSAWSYWEDLNVEFVSGIFDGNMLYMTVIRDGKLMLMKLSLQETVSGDVDGLEIMLDYRVDTPSTTFDGSNTTVTLPYNTIAGEEYVAVMTVDGVDKAGTAYVGTSTSGNTITFENIDLSAETFLIGRKYEFEYELSPIFIRDDGKVPIQDGRLQLRYLSFLYHQSSYFRIEVTSLGRPTYTSLFAGRVLGRLTDTIGSVAVDDGEFRVSVSGRSDQTDIRIINDSPFNCRFSSIEWEGAWRPKTKRMR